MYNDLSLITRDIERMKKKRRTKKIIRRLLFLAVVVAIAIAISSKAVSFTKKNTKALSQNELQSDLKKYQKVKVVVQKGDTLWDLQERLTPNGDIEKLLCLDKEILGCSANLQPGDTVTLLK